MDICWFWARLQPRLSPSTEPLLGEGEARKTLVDLQSWNQKAENWGRSTAWPILSTGHFLSSGTIWESEELRENLWKIDWNVLEYVVLKKRNPAGWSSWTQAHGWNPCRIFASFWEGKYEVWLGISEGRAWSIIFKNLRHPFWLVNMLIFLMIIKLNLEHFFNYFQIILKFFFAQSTHIAKVLTLHLAWRPPERQTSHRHTSLLYVELELFLHQVLNTCCWLGLGCSTLYFDTSFHSHSWDFSLLIISKKLRLTRLR